MIGVVRVTRVLSQMARSLTAPRAFVNPVPCAQEQGGGGGGGGGKERKHKHRSKSKAGIGGEGGGPVSPCFPEYSIVGISPWMETIFLLVANSANIPKIDSTRSSLWVSKHTR